MDQINSSYIASSYHHQQQHQHKSIKLKKQTCLNSLHSVRKPFQKPTNKHYIAPMPPTPPKTYKIDSSNFKESVRMLTSTPEFQYPPTRRLKDIAPPPLVLSTIPKPSSFPKSTTQSQSQTLPLEDGNVMSPLSSFIMSADFFNLLDNNNTFASTSSMDYFGGSSPVAYEAFGGTLMSPFGFSLSPTSLSWCSSVLRS